MWISQLILVGCPRAGNRTLSVLEAAGLDIAVSDKERWKTVYSFFLKMPISEAVGTAADEAFLIIKPPAGAEIGTLAFARARVADARAALNTEISKLASKDAARSLAEYRGEIVTALKPTWKTVLQHMPNSLFQPTESETRRKVLAAFLEALLMFTTLNERYKDIYKSETESRRLSSQLDDSLGLPAAGGGGSAPGAAAKHPLTAPSAAYPASPSVTPREPSMAEQLITAQEIPWPNAPAFGVPDPGPADHQAVSQWPAGVPAQNPVHTTAEAALENERTITPGLPAAEIVNARRTAPLEDPQGGQTSTPVARDLPSWVVPTTACTETGTRPPAPRPPAQDEQEVEDTVEEAAENQAAAPSFFSQAGLQEWFDGIFGTFLAVFLRTVATIAAVTAGSVPAAITMSLMTAGSFARWCVRTSDIVLKTATGALVTASGAAVTTGSEIIGMFAIFIRCVALLQGHLSGALFTEAQVATGSRPPSRQGSGRTTPRQEDDKTELFELKKQIAALQAAQSAAGQPKPIPPLPVIGAATCPRGATLAVQPQVQPPGDDLETSPTVTALQHLMTGGPPEGLMTMTGAQGGLPGSQMPWKGPGSPAHLGTAAAGSPRPNYHGSPQSPTTAMQQCQQPPSGVPGFPHLTLPGATGARAYALQHYGQHQGQQPGPSGGAHQVAPGAGRQTWQPSGAYGAVTGSDPYVSGRLVSAIPAGKGRRARATYENTRLTSAPSIRHWVEHTYASNREGAPYLRAFQIAVNADTELEKAYELGGYDGVIECLEGSDTIEIAPNTLGTLREVGISGDERAGEVMMLVKPPGGTSILPEEVLAEGRSASQNLYKQEVRTQPSAGAGANVRARRAGWFSKPQASPRPPKGGGKGAKDGAQDGGGGARRRR